MSQSRTPRVRATGQSRDAGTVAPHETAKVAGLRYVSDAQAGISRIPKGDRFLYVFPDGRRVRDAQTLDRIRSLGIPPAWSDVWITTAPNGHLQATGRDAKGRKQYRYHPRWRAVRDESKYNQLIAFGEALPRIRAAVERDLAQQGLSWNRVLAVVVALLDETFIRVGNEQYARENHSFGLTTLRDQHVAISGAKLTFKFRGKSGKLQEVAVKDRTLSRIIQRLRDLPGYGLFQYLDEDGERHAVDSADVNTYLREVSGEHFTAKDFRTWAGTVTATDSLEHLGEPGTAVEAKHNVVEAIGKAAERLGNTPTICRKCYVHPGVVDAYLDGTLFREERRLTPSEIKRSGLSPEEARVLAMLRRLEERPARQQAKAS